MAFNSITIDTRTFNSVGNGSYSLSTVEFGEPENTIKITPGRASRGASGVSTTSCAVTRHLGKDVTVGSDTERRRATVNVNVVVPTGFTAVEIDALIADISTFVSVDNLTRILLGES